MIIYVLVLFPSLLEKILVVVVGFLGVHRDVLEWRLACEVTEGHVKFATLNLVLQSFEFGLKLVLFCLNHFNLNLFMN